MSGISKGRLQSVDAAKGIGIVAVAFFHAVGFSAGGELGEAISGLHACFGGVLGVFFFLSGYFYKPGRGFAKNALHRTKNLLLPAILLAAIISVTGYFAEWIFDARVPLAEYAVNFLRYLFDPYAFQPFAATTDSVYNAARAYYFLLPLWFAYRLYFSDLIFYALADRVLGKFRYTAAAVIALLAFSTLYKVLAPVHFAFQLESCCAYAALILTGAYCSRYDLLEKLENGYKKKEYWLVFAGFAVLYVLAVIFLKNYFGQRIFCGMFDVRLEDGPEAVVCWFVCQLIMCYVTMFVCSWIVKLPGVILKPVLCCGHASMLILALHSVLEWVFANLFGETEIFLTRLHSETEFSASIWKLALSVVATVVFCCLVDFLSGKIRGVKKERETQ